MRKAQSILAACSIPVFVCALAACDAPKKEGAAASGSAKSSAAPKTSAAAKSSAPASAASSAAAAPPPPSAPVGLEAAGNDASIVTAIKKIVAECDANWTAEKGYKINSECAAHKAYAETKIEEGKMDATFVNLLEDPNEKVRALGHFSLVRWGDAFKTDKAMAERVVAVAEKETSTAFAGALGLAVADIDLDKTELGPRIKTLALSDKTNVDLRAALITFVLNENSKSAAAQEILKEAFASSDPKIRDAVMEGWGGAYSENSEAACAAWIAGMADPDETVAATAMSFGTIGDWTINWVGNDHVRSSSSFVEESKCDVSKFEPLAEQLTVKAKDGKITQEGQVLALFGLARDKKTSDATKKAAVAGLRAVIENKDNKSRSAAVSSLSEVDKTAKTFLKKFEKDSDVSSAVNNALIKK